MEVNVETGPIQAAHADTLVVNLFEGVTAPAGATGAIDAALDGAISALIAAGDFQGKQGETTVLYPRGALHAERVIVVGLGKQEKIDLEAIRLAAAAAAKRASELGATHLATIAHGAGIGGVPAAEAAQATLEGMLLASYRFNSFKQADENKRNLQRFTLVEYDAEKSRLMAAAADVAVAIAEGVALARDLVNLPPNYATPARMAEAAQTIADTYGMKITIGGRSWAAERRLGAFLAVAQGAGVPPKFIVLEHNADRTDWPAIVLAGKGITFDSGGLSLKTTEGMPPMKADMGGAAAVLGAMHTIGSLGLPLRVIAITPCTENMPDSLAYRPSDVITAGNGKTIEIISTDAEGRLVLADALGYAARYEPAAVIDLATLTGSSVVALGQGVAASLFSNDDSLRDALLDASRATYERVWPMPLYDDYRRTIESDVADMKNSGGRFGGVGTSAVFLEAFTSYPWAHLDIAGLALTDKGNAYTPSRASGFGVRLLVQYLRTQAT